MPLKPRWTLVGNAGGFLTAVLYAGLGCRHDRRAALGRVEAPTQLATPFKTAPSWQYAEGRACLGC